MYKVIAVHNFSKQILEYTEYPYQLLEFSKGEQICVTKQGMNSGNKCKMWLYGHIATNQAVCGWFPSNFVVNTSSTNSNYSYFGRQITQVCQDENRVVPSVPYRLSERIFKLLNNHNTNKQGIFRVPGDATAIAQLLQQDTISDQDIGKLDIFTTCALFKKFYQLLPSKFIQQYQMEELSSQINMGNFRGVARLLQKLQSIEDFMNLRYLLYVLSSCLRFSEETTMPVETISQLFTQHVIACQDTQEQSSTEEQQVLIGLILNYDAVEHYIKKKYPLVDYNMKLSDLPYLHKYNTQQCQQVVVAKDFIMEQQLQKCMNLRRDDVVTVIDKKGDWAFICKDGFHGWVPAELVQTGMSE